MVESSEAHRTCGGWSVTPTEFAASATLDVVRDGDEYREARKGADSDATFEFGPGPVGGFLRFSVRPERVVPGSSAAPEVVRAFRFADRRLGTGFGELTAARDGGDRELWPMAVNESTSNSPTSRMARSPSPVRFRPVLLVLRSEAPISAERMHRGLRLANMKVGTLRENMALPGQEHGRRGP